MTDYKLNKHKSYLAFARFTINTCVPGDCFLPSVFPSALAPTMPVLTIQLYSMLLLSIDYVCVVRLPAIGGFVTGQRLDRLLATAAVE